MQVIWERSISLIKMFIIQYDIHAFFWVHRYIDENCVSHVYSSNDADWDAYSSGALGSNSRDVRQDKDGVTICTSCILEPQVQVDEEPTGGSIQPSQPTIPTPVKTTQFTISLAAVSSLQSRLDVSSTATSSTPTENSSPASPQSTVNLQTAASAELFGETSTPHIPLDYPKTSSPVALAQDIDLPLSPLEVLPPRPKVMTERLASFLSEKKSCNKPGKSRKRKLTGLKNQ